ncbi:MAG: spore coat protein CotJB, partial [Halobacillus sp.]
MNNPSEAATERYELMEKIQMVDFALVELTLYLDTHPNDFQAIQQFNELAVQSR